MGEKINILTVFFIFHKSSGKTFLKWIVNQYSKSTCQHDPKKHRAITNFNYLNNFQSNRRKLEITYIKFKYDIRKSMSTGRFYTGRNVKGQALDISYINSRTLKRASSEQALDELIGP